MRKSPRSKRYSEAFKRQAAAEMEAGKATVPEFRWKYGIGGDLTVLGWPKRYGTGKVQGKKAGGDEALAAASSRPNLSLGPAGEGSAPFLRLQHHIVITAISCDRGVPHRTGTLRDG